MAAVTSHAPQGSDVWMCPIPADQGFQCVVSGVSFVDRILSRFPGSCGLTKDTPPPQSRRSHYLYLADEKRAQRGEAAYLKSHSCDKAVLESSTEGDADGDGARGARVEADGADSVGDPGADPDVMIFMVGLGSDAG